MYPRWCVDGSGTPGYRGRVKAANPAQVRTPRLTRLEYDVLEVYRDPERTAAGRWRYATVRVLEPGAVVSPLAAPRARLRVADLLA